MNIKESKLYQDKKWLQQQFDELGHTRTIANKYKISEWTVDNWAKKLEIKKNPLRRMSSRTKKINESYFDKIDTENKAYWIGFIMADGCVTKTNKKYPPNRLHICLKYDEEKHIYKFIKDLDSDYKPKTRNIKNKKRGFESKVCELRVNSKPLVTALGNHGIVLNKTGKEYIPSTIPKLLVRHFIRGFFDGDGSITKSNAFRICSQSKKILNQIVSVFEKDLNITFKIYCDNNYKEPFYTIDSRHSGNNKKALDYLYKDSTIYLDRKYDRYTRMFSPTTE